MGDRRNRHRPGHATTAHGPRHAHLHDRRPGGGTYPGQRIAGAGANDAPRSSCGWNTCDRGSSSWSLSGSIARGMGFDHAPSGAWVAYLVIAVMLAVAVLAYAFTCWRRDCRTGAPARTLLRVPRAAWTCALVGLLSAACWTVITPPFQAPDEPSHFAYAHCSPKLDDCRTEQWGCLPGGGERRQSPAPGRSGVAPGSPHDRLERQSDNFKKT